MPDQIRTVMLLTGMPITNTDNSYRPKQIYPSTGLRAIFLPRERKTIRF